jgi:hypothetical protein
MKRDEHLLVILAEECAEVTKEVSKALRFGLDDKELGKQETNRERISKEVADLIGVFEMLCDSGIIKPYLLYDTEAKKIKVEKYLKYSKEVGTLQDGHKYY